MLVRIVHRNKMAIILLVCGISIFMTGNILSFHQNKKQAIFLEEGNNQHFKYVNNIGHNNNYNVTSIKYTGSKFNISNALVPKKYFLVALLSVRIYEYDKPKWSTTDLEQWIQYMFYAGVEHIYFYDNYKFLSESLEEWCRLKYSPTLITYHDWSKYHPYKLKFQVDGYKHALATYGNVSTWQIAFDMDEYPFPLKDMNPGFLKRFLLKQIKLTPEVSEYCFNNFLFLGQPKNRTYVIERFLRRTPNKANRLVKPLFLTSCMETAGIHRNKRMCGLSKDVDSNVMRMNHYWGARLQNWGEDTPEIISKTVLDESGFEMARKVYG